MLSKRNVVLLSLVLCTLVAVWRKDGLLRRLRERHVRETVLVSAGGLRMASFFDGLAPNPRFNAARAMQAVRGVPRCGAKGSAGFLALVASLFERTAHAQGGCSSSCGPCYFQIAPSTHAAALTAARTRSTA